MGELTYPRDIRVLHFKFLGNFGDGQRYGEEIKSIPNPSDKAAPEHEPLVTVKLAENANWISKLSLKT
jgi:hypothetical protein